MNELTQFFKGLGTREFLFIGFGVVLFIVLLFLYRSIKIKRYRKRIVEIENHINGIKSLPLQYRLGRVHSISKNMPDVLLAYEEYSQEFERINEFQKNELGILVNEVDEQLFYGKLSKVLKKMKMLDEMVQTYEADSQALLAKIEKITEIENIQRIEIIRVKESYRQAIESYEAIRFKVEEYVPNLLNIFTTIDDSFVKLEGMMNNQLFESASQYTSEIETKVLWLKQSLEELPNYISVIRQYLPEKVAHIHELIHDMSDENFSLNQLNTYQRCEIIEQQLTEATQRVKDLDLQDMGPFIQELSQLIETLIYDLETEKAAFEEFKEKWEATYTIVKYIYDQYKDMTIDYNRIKSLYVIEDAAVEIDVKFAEFDSILKASYDLEKQMLAGDFAYSKMIVEVEAMKEEAQEHQKYLSDFVTWRDHLYLQEQRAIDELENINIVLLEIKSEIKNKHLPMINESYKDYIQDSYDKAAQIQAFRQSRPVELSELSLRVDGARDVIYKLYDNVHNLIVTAEMVEEAIVFGNRYRSTFLEVNTELTKAEVLFRNGEYTKALSTAVDIIEKIKSGSYEELIRRSSTKSV